MHLKVPISLLSRINRMRSTLWHLVRELFFSDYRLFGIHEVYRKDIGDAEDAQLPFFHIKRHHMIGGGTM